MNGIFSMTSKGERRRLGSKRRVEEACTESNRSVEGFGESFSAACSRRAGIF
jgi:hypothetical protein